MRFFSSNEQSEASAVLGVHLSKAEVRAALVRRREDGYFFADRFHRYRGEAEEGGGQQPFSGGSGLPGEGSSGLPGEGESDVGVSDTDYTLEFSDGGGSQAGPREGQDKPQLGGEGGEEGEEDEMFPFPSELEDIISACRQRHGGEFEIVFTSEVGGVELEHIASDTKLDEPPPSSSDLLDLLNGHRDDELRSDQVAFHPFEGRGGERREYLAIIRSANDPVVETLRKVKERRQVEIPSVLGLQSELSVLLDPVIRSAWTSEGDEGNTTLVRVGSDDTVAVFLQDGELVDEEHLPSVSVHDAPDKVCKRVLLYQDEAGVEDPDRIVLLAEGQEEGFKVHFNNLYPEVDVISLYALIADRIGEGPSKDDQPAGLFALAATTAWQVLESEEIREEYNLLPRALRGKEKIRFAWHTWAALTLLFAATLFLVFRYQHQQTQIAQLQQEIDRYPSAQNMTTEEIQSQIDSIETVYQQYATGLQELDSLLVDADQWSQMMDRVVQVRQQVPGVWIRSWTPTSPGRIEIIGLATQRDRVVEMADRLDARLQSIETAEIRGFPVFRYTMSAPLPTGLPRATQYLRENDTLTRDTSIARLQQ